MSDSDIAVLSFPEGIEARILSLGATIASLDVPVKGRMQNVVLSYDDASLYRSDQYYLGSTVGRYANRIRGGRFSLNGEVHQLTVQQNGHCLHGGPDGLNRRAFSLDASPDGRSVSCRYLSPDGDQGFPGNLEIVVRYEIVDEMSLAIEYTASTDRLTVVNLTNHAYFNLEGGGSSIEDHRLRVNASQFTEVDEETVPTGTILTVDGTALDLRVGKRVGDVLAEHGDIDNNFVIDRGQDDLVLASSLVSPKTGIRLDVLTTQPGVQVFTGQNLIAPFRPYGAICLETQNFPDAPNNAAFPSSELSVEGTYRERTMFKFSTGQSGE